MNKTLTGLLPCPFCGGTNCTVSTRTIGKWKFVYCPDCLAEGPADDMEVVAIADWNRRATQQPEPRDEATPLRVERHSDMSVLVVFSSCRQASVFEKEILARAGAAHE